MKITKIVLITIIHCYGMQNIQSQNNNIQELTTKWGLLTNEMIALNNQILTIYRANSNSQFTKSDEGKIAELKLKVDSVTHLAHNANLEMDEAEFNQKLQEVLDTDPKDIKKSEEKLGWLLVSTQWRNFIAKHTNELLPYVDHDYKLYSDNLEILLLINTPPNIKDSLLHMDNLKLEQRARLGDSIAENAIIKDFLESMQKPSTDDEFLKKGEKLLYVGTKKCLKTYISGFGNNNVLYYENYKIKSSVLIMLITEYNAYFPEEYITARVKSANHLDPMSWRLYGNKPFKQEEDYFRELEVYCFKVYGVKLDIDLPFLEVFMEQAYPH